MTDKQYYSILRRYTRVISQNGTSGPRHSHMRLKRVHRQSGRPRSVGIHFPASKNPLGVQIRTHARLLADDCVNAETKKRLQEISEELDPVQLLAEIRQEQQRLAELEVGRRRSYS